MKRVLLASAVLLGLACAAQAERRMALVFGMNGYKTLRPLGNAVNDARTIEEALGRLGFEVVLETNRDLRRMRRALDDFREDAAGADVALVFYAGHGVEIAGENRLLPVDADASSLLALKASTLPLEEVRDAVAASARVGLIVLDACRNDPFGASGGGRSAATLRKELAGAVKPGLGRVGRAENALFSFSAAPGQTASDGAGENSPFTSALAQYLGTDGLEVRSVLTLVQQAVYDETRGQQLPYVESGLPKLFFASARAGKLPERERLLLAMAELTPELRDEVERTAAAGNVPLAPLYAALFSADLASLARADRAEKLAQAARAFTETRNRLQTLAASDPAVAQFRAQADEKLALGALSEARAKLAQAAELDARSGEALAANLVRRRLSEAATHAADGGVARTQLDYSAAVGALEKAAALHARVEREAVPDASRRDRDWLLAELGDIHLLTGDTAAALGAFTRMKAAAELRLSDAPGLPDAERDLSAAQARIGDVKRAQGDLAGALAAYEADLAIASRLAVAGGPAAQRDLAISRNKIGDVRKAQGDLDGALAAYRASLGIRERLAASGGGDAAQRDLALGRTKLGDGLLAQGDGAGALAAYAASLDIRLRLAAGQPGDGGRQRDLKVGWDSLGNAKLAGGDLGGALAAYRASLDIAVRLAAQDPGDTGRQHDLSVSRSNTGDVRLAQGDAPGALADYRASLDTLARLAARDGANSGWQRDLSVGFNKLGDVAAAQGDFPGALAAYQSALDIRLRLAALDPGNAEWQRDLALAQDRVGDARRGRDDLAGALPAYEAGLAVVARLAAADAGDVSRQRDLAAAHAKVGDAKRLEGDKAGALRAYRAAFAITAQLAAQDAAGDGRDLMLAHYRLAQAGDAPRENFAAALAIARRMEARGSLKAADGWMPYVFEAELAQLGVKPE